MVLIMIVATFFAIPLAYLLVIQTQNYLLNETTNMRFSRYRRGGYSRETNEHSEVMKYVEKLLNKEESSEEE